MHYLKIFWTWISHFIFRAGFPSSPSVLTPQRCCWLPCACGSRDSAGDWWAQTLLHAHDQCLPQPPTHPSQSSCSCWFGKVQDFHPLAPQCSPSSPQTFHPQLLTDPNTAPCTASIRNNSALRLLFWIVYLYASFSHRRASTWLWVVYS